MAATRTESAWHEGTKQKARTARAEAALDQTAPQRERQAELKLRSERLGKTILETSGLCIERDGRRLIEGLDLALRPGERIGVVGPNGSGKTSLLLALLGELPLAQGSIILGSNTKIGYLDQSRACLNDAETVREAAVGDANQIVVGDEQLSVGSYLERFLFRRPQQRVRVGELSGGERARVCLARLLAQKCNLLLMDEPTNDLDVATLSALESMLIDFGGCVILVSHDRWMLDRVATSILAFEGEGRTELHVGGYSDYRARQLRERSRESQAPDRSAESVRRSEARSTRSAVTAKKLTHAERLELDGLFEKIEAAEARVAELQVQLADPEIYQGPGEAVAAIRSDLQASEAEAARLTARWEDLEERKMNAATGGLPL